MYILIKSKKYTIDIKYINETKINNIMLFMFNGYN